MSGCCSSSDAAFGDITPRVSDFFMFDFANPNQTCAPALSSGEYLVAAAFATNPTSIPDGETPNNLEFGAVVITGPADRPNTIAMSKSMPGASAGVTYTITCLVTTNSGRILESSGVVSCRGPETL